MEDDVFPTEKEDPVTASDPAIQPLMSPGWWLYTWRSSAPSGAAVSTKPTYSDLCVSSLNNEGPQWVWLMGGLILQEWDFWRIVKGINVQSIMTIVAMAAMGSIMVSSGWVRPVPGYGAALSASSWVLHIKNNGKEWDLLWSGCTAAI